MDEHNGRTGFNNYNIYYLSYMLFTTGSTFEIDSYSLFVFGQ